MSTRDDVEFFFTAPELGHDVAKRALGPNGFGMASVLYLLRREAQGCMLSVRIPQSDDDFLATIRKERNCLFAFLMVVFSGVDLLSKFWVGNGNSPVGPRFIGFLEEYGSIGRAEARRIYTLRNSLMHSFGLFDPNNASRIPLEQTCSDGCPDTGSLVFDVNGSTVVCIVHCWLLFVTSMRSYEEDLLYHVDNSTGDLDEKFRRMFPDYGYLRF